MVAYKVWSIFFIVVTISQIHGRVPDYIKICSKKTDLSKCLLENFNNVMKFLCDNDEKDFKIPSTKRRFLEKFELQATKNLKIILQNITFTGIDTSEAKEIDIKDDMLYMKLHADYLTYDGMYEIHGKLLIFPIEGTGLMHSSLKDYSLDYKAKLKIEERKGKKYYYIENSHDGVTAIIPQIGKFELHFDNLFGGDPVMGNEINAFFNENWVELFNELKEALELTGTYLLLNPIINSYLRHIPIDELFLSD